MPESLLIAILAAGASRRLGSPKQLLNFQGETLLHRQCRIALEAELGEVVTILGCHAELCQEAVADLAVETVPNPEWEQGMSSSVRHAAKTAINRGCDGLLILLVDQFQLTCGDLRLLAEAWQGNPDKIALSISEEYQGPPAIFPKPCFDDLLQLQGDRGAKSFYLNLPATSIQKISIPNAVSDCDTIKDVAQMNL